MKLQKKPLTQNTIGGGGGLPKMFKMPNDENKSPITFRSAGTSGKDSLYVLLVCERH